MYKIKEFKLSPEIISKSSSSHTLDQKPTILIPKPTPTPSPNICNMFR